MNEPVIAVRCEEPGCTALGEELWLPDWGDGANEPYHYCHEHARAHGWCPGCLGFWGGIESFDFSHTGFCESCTWDMEAHESDDYSYWP